MQRIGSTARRVMAAVTVALVFSAVGLSGAFAAVGAVGLPPTADHVAPAFPATLPVASAITWMQSALAVRTSALATLTASVDASTTLTSSDRAALGGVLSNDASAIAALAQKVPTETTIPALRRDAQQMVGYHVIALVTPVVNDVIAIDSALASARSLSNQVAALDAAIAAARQSRQNVSEANAYAQHLGNRLRDVTTQIGTLGATLLALNPSNWPAPNTTLQQASSAINRADSDLVGANNDVNQIVRLLSHPAAKSNSTQKLAS